jgi:hypothetical protein
MAKRKITCENTVCKYHGLNDICKRESIKLAYGGKCDSFEKGFTYYFHLVWEALGKSNYIDFVTINRNPDLCIGIFYVCKIWDINYSIMGWRMCRLLAFQESEKSEPLKYEQIIGRKRNNKEFDYWYNKFEEGVLPAAEVKETETKATEELSFGWLSPSGKFIEADWAKHEKAAEIIIQTSGFQEEYDKYEKDIGRSATYRDFLQSQKGYCLIHNPSIYGPRQVSYETPLTKAQRNFLYDYFTKLGDLFSAEKYFVVEE